MNFYWSRSVIVILFVKTLGAELRFVPGFLCVDVMLVKIEDWSTLETTFLINSSSTIPVSMCIMHED